MELDYIHEFITLAQMENYVAAAEELYISQPSLTKHIKALETELGVSLFDRTTRKVRLNRFGQAYLPFAERIADADREARNSLSMLARDASDTLHLGVLPSFVSYGIQDHLVNFKWRFPDYSVTLTEGSNDDLLQYLVNGRCNVAFVRHFSEIPAQFIAIPYIHDSMVLTIPQGHPFDDGRTSVRLEDLAGIDLFVSTSPTETRILDQLSRETGIKLRIVNKLQRTDSIIEMLTKGFGAALLMRVPTSFFHGDKVKTVDIEPAVSSTISLVYWKKQPLSLAVRSFIGVVFPDRVKGGEHHG